MPWLLSAWLLACTTGTDTPQRKPTEPDTTTSGPTKTDPTDTVTDTDPSDTGTPPEPGGTLIGPPLPAVCDAGTESWVQRTMPLMWGRKAHGVSEVAYWSQAADIHGREAVVRAMAADPEFVDWWRDWFMDALQVARAGDRMHDGCFESPMLDLHDGALTAHLLASGPEAEPFTSRFNMADVIADALVADDVSVIYQAHLFARMARPVQGGNVSPEELEFNRRVGFGDGFYRTYLSRSLDCVPCHNSEYSVTDHADPALDRTWQLPGYVEQAVFGSSSGLDSEVAYSMFRTEGITPLLRGVTPWGMDEACGLFRTSGAIRDEDFLGSPDGFFVESFDATGSVYDLERLFASGRARVSGKGMTVQADGTVDGEEAFVYLVASTVVDQVWQLASGERLIVAHDFPRNQAQRDRLQSLVDPFVASGFSLVNLLVDVATDEWLTAGVPQTCDTQPYGMPPVFDPWVIEDDDPQLRANGPGDTVHRMNARALLRSVHHSLSWRPYPAWHSVLFATSNEEFQAAIGVFLRDSSPGHDGSDLQGLLAWESEFGACRTDVAFGELDAVGRILELAEAEGATVGDVALAVSDRLLIADIDAVEQPLVEAILERSFAEPIPVDDADFELAVRRYCGAMLLTPQFQLVADPGPTPAPPLLDIEAEADCARVAERMTGVGSPMSCGGTTLK